MHLASAQGYEHESHLCLVLFDSMFIFIFQGEKAETQKMMQTYDPKMPTIFYASLRNAQQYFFSHTTCFTSSRASARAAEEYLRFSFPILHSPKKSRASARAADEYLRCPWRKLNRLWEIAFGESPSGGDDFAAKFGTPRIEICIGNNVEIRISDVEIQISGAEIHFSQAISEYIYKYIFEC